MSVGPRSQSSLGAHVCKKYSVHETQAEARANKKRVKSAEQGFDVPLT